MLHSPFRVRIKSPSSFRNMGHYVNEGATRFFFDTAKPIYKECNDAFSAGDKCYFSPLA